MASSGGEMRCPRCDTEYAPEHRFCGSCGFEVGVAEPAPAPPVPPRAVDPPPRASAELDRLVGTTYEPSRDLDAAPAERPDAALRYYIPTNRVVLLTILSGGLYVFYWMYTTWRQYRDHTRETAYPVFHALTLIVLVYQFFRLHAHMRVFQELMLARGVPSTLSPMRAVGIFFGVIVLQMLALRPTGEPTITTTQQMVNLAITLVQVGMLTWLVVKAQGNLNRYWQHVLGANLGVAPVSIMEIVLVVLGLIQWVLIAILIIDPTLIPADPTIGS